ncbi:MAG: flagellar filament capping protein FliD, partial [Deltaproteobacteria bacterium]|nr:flagellar filament capping protein FliD [Deltaproteobacteria bacterium]
TFTFTVSGTDTVTVGTDSFEMQWTDTEGNSGLISVSPTAYTDIEVYQGIKISLAEGTVEGNDTFSVDVTNTTIQSAAAEGLAQAEVETHSGFVDENTSSVTTVDGTFSYTYGGVTRTLVVPANATLLDLRNLINNDGSNPGVTAAILNDGSGLSTAFHLQLSGNHSGAAYTINSITHSLDNFARGGSSGYGFTQTQEAHNAFIKVDGYPPDGSEYIQRSSNTIADLVSGVTLNLSSAGSATVSITTDVSAIKAKIETFVESINAALDFIKEMTTYDQNGAGENNGPMIGNYAFQIVQHRINAILSTAVPGLVDGVDDYTNLSQIGIATDPDQNGKWVIDETLLNTALNTDIESVCSLFIQNETTGIDGMAELIYAETENLTESYSDANPGIVSVLIENYEGIIDNIDAKIEREERRLALVENRLNTKYSRLEVLLGQLEGQTAFLTSLIESLNGTGQD